MRNKAWKAKAIEKIGCLWAYIPVQDGIWWQGSYTGNWDALSSQKTAKIDLQNCSKNQKLQKSTKFTMNSSFSTKTRCTWVVLLESWYKPSFPYNNFSQYCEILPKCCKIAYIVKNLIFHDSFFWSCKFDVLWYFHQLRSCRMGAFVMNYVNTAHDAVKYCTNTPKEYKSPWIKCFFIYVYLGMYWELHGLGWIK